MGRTTKQRLPRGGHRLVLLGVAAVLGACARPESQKHNGGVALALDMSEAVAAAENQLSLAEALTSVVVPLHAAVEVRAGDKMFFRSAVRDGDVLALDLPLGSIEIRSLVLRERRSSDWRTRDCTATTSTPLPTPVPTSRAGVAGPSATPTSGGGGSGGGEPKIFVGALSETVSVTASTEELPVNFGSLVAVSWRRVVSTVPESLVDPTGPIGREGSPTRIVYSDALTQSPIMDPCTGKPHFAGARQGLAELVVPRADLPLLAVGGFRPFSPALLGSSAANAEWIRMGDDILGLAVMGPMTSPRPTPSTSPLPTGSLSTSKTSTSTSTSASGSASPSSEPSPYLATLTPDTTAGGALRLGLLAADDGDADGDGVTNAEEIKNNTNPLRKTVSFPLTTSTPLEGGSLNARLTTTPDFWQLYRDTHCSVTINTSTLSKADTVRLMAYRASLPMPLPQNRVMPPLTGMSSFGCYQGLEFVGIAGVADVSIEVLDHYGFLAGRASKSGVVVAVPAVVASPTPNANLAPTGITLSRTTFPENLPAGTRVANINGADPNPGDVLRFELGTEADSANFAIVDNSLNLFNPANFEAKKQYLISIIAIDSGGLRFQVPLTLNVSNVNEAPTLGNVANQLTNENESITGLSLSINDPDGPLSCSEALTATASNTALLPSGTLSLGGTYPSCTLSISPADHQQGSSTVTLTVSDGLLSAQRTFLLTVNAAKGTPVMKSDGDTSAATSRDLEVKVQLASGYEPGPSTPGQSLSYFVSTKPANGALGTLPNGAEGGSVTYTPDTGYLGNDSFSYQICNNAATPACSPARTVTLSVNAVNSAPTLTSPTIGSLTGTEDTDLSIPLASATGPDAGDSLTYKLLMSPNFGTLLTSLEGAQLGTSITYSPNPDWSGSDSFSYKICDNSSACTANVVVNISISPVNDRPEFSLKWTDIKVREGEGASVPFNLSDSDNTVPCSAIRMTVSPSPQGVVSSIEGSPMPGDASFNCQLQLTPGTGVFGQESIELRISDGADDSLPTFLAVTSTPVAPSDDLWDSSQRRVFWDQVTNRSWSVFRNASGGLNVESSADNLVWRREQTLPVIATHTLREFTVVSDNAGKAYIVYILDQPTTQQVGYWRLSLTNTPVSFSDQSVTDRQSVGQLAATFVSATDPGSLWIAFRESMLPDGRNRIVLQKVSDPSSTAPAKTSQNPASSVLSSPFSPVLALALAPDPEGKGDVILVAQRREGTESFRVLDGNPNWTTLGEPGRQLPVSLVQDGLRNGEIFAATIHRGSLVVGGSFELPAAKIKNLARWNGSGWVGMGSGFNDAVRALTVDGAGNLYAGGDFTQSSGTPLVALKRLAVWRGSQWDPVGEGLPSGSITALGVSAWDSSEILVGGSFSLVGPSPGIVATNFATWSPHRMGTKNGWITTGNDGPEGPVYALASMSGVVYVGGAFTSLNHSNGNSGANSIAQWNPGTGSWNPVPSPGGGVRSLAVHAPLTAPTLIAGGTFGAKYLSGGATWTTISGVSGPVNSVYVASSNQIYLGINGGNQVGRAATLGGTVTTLPVLSGGPAPIINAMAGSGVSLFALGRSYSTPYQPAAAEYRSSGWRSINDSFTGTINAVKVDPASGDIYVGGSFASIGGVAGTNNLARWSAVNNHWTSTGYTSGTVHALEIAGGRLYVGGSFTAPCPNIAFMKLTLPGSLQCVSDGGTNGPVRALRTLDGSYVYVGGAFTTAGDKYASNFAKIKSTETTPEWMSASSINGPVIALEFHSGNLYAGRMPSGGDSGLVYFNSGVWTTPPAGPINGPVNALASDGTSLYVGGSFSSAGALSTGANNLVMMGSSSYSPLGTDDTASGLGVLALAVANTGSTKLWVGGEFSGFRPTLQSYNPSEPDANKRWSVPTGTSGIVRALAASTSSVTPLALGGDGLAATVRSLATGPVGQLTLVEGNAKLLLASRTFGMDMDNIELRSLISSGSSWDVEHGFTVPGGSEGSLGLTNESSAIYTMHWVQNGQIWQAELPTTSTMSLITKNPVVSLNPRGQFAVPTNVQTAKQLVLMFLGAGDTITRVGDPQPLPQP